MRTFTTMLSFIALGAASLGLQGDLFAQSDLERRRGDVARCSPGGKLDWSAVGRADATLTWSAFNCKLTPTSCGGSIMWVGRPDGMKDFRAWDQSYQARNNELTALKIAGAQATGCGQVFLEYGPMGGLIPRLVVPDGAFRR